MFKLLSLGGLLEKSWKLWKKKLSNYKQEKQKKNFKQAKIKRRKWDTQFFLEHLLAPLALVGWPYFCLTTEPSEESLIVDLAISETKSIRGEIAIDIFRYSLWK